MGLNEKMYSKKLRNILELLDKLSVNFF